MLYDPNLIIQINKLYTYTICFSNIINKQLYVVCKDAWYFDINLLESIYTNNVVELILNNKSKCINYNITNSRKI